MVDLNTGNDKEKKETKTKIDDETNIKTTQKKLQTSTLDHSQSQILS